MVKVKSALELLYIGTADVYEKTQSTDAETHRTGSTPTRVLTAIPCRLSFSQNPPTTAGDAAQVLQTVKLFFDPSYTIKAGSKIEVTQNGVTTAYKHSGVEAVYSTHKEIVLELFDRWA